MYPVTSEAGRCPGGLTGLPGWSAEKIILHRKQPAVPAVVPLVRLPPQTTEVTRENDHHLAVSKLGANLRQILQAGMTPEDMSDHL